MVEVVCDVDPTIEAEQIVASGTVHLIAPVNPLNRREASRTLFYLMFFKGL